MTENLKPTFTQFGDSVPPETFQTGAGVLAKGIGTDLKLTTAGTSYLTWIYKK